MNTKLRLFSLYADAAASAKARKVAAKISRLAGSQCETSSEMWKFDLLLASESIREMAADDAANADVLIVAINSLAQREPAMIEWLENLAVWQSGGPGSGMLIALLGDEAHKTLELDWTVRSLIRCANRMERDFSWRWMGEDAMNNLDWLRQDIDNLLTQKLVMENEVVL